MENKINKWLEDMTIDWELIDLAIDNIGQFQRIVEVCKWHTLDLKGCADILEQIAPLVDIFTSEGFILRCKRRFPGCNSWENEDDENSRKE